MKWVGKNIVVGENIGFVTIAAGCEPKFIGDSHGSYQYSYNDVDGLSIISADKNGVAARKTLEAFKVEGYKANLQKAKFKKDLKTYGLIN